MGRIKSTIIVFWSLVGFFSTAQTDKNPTVWSHEVKDLGDENYEITIKADIAPEWYIYSLYTAEGGSMPSEFIWHGAGVDYELMGKTEEGKTYKKYTEVFDVEETFFKGKAIFIQKIKRMNPKVKQLKTTLAYQICKEVCILQEEEFIISLTGEQPIIEVPSATLSERDKALSEALILNLKNKERLQTPESRSHGQNSLYSIFGLGFLGGLIALLTPCVFPLIPLTVSFFTKRTSLRSKGIIDALLYGFFIVLIYALLSLPFHLFGSVDSQILNTIATNVWLNLLFFIIFVFFAFSFFGYYELTLPNSWANKMDGASQRVGGLVSIFFMALTLAIVSFSCTGPILGGLLGSTALASGDVATNLTAGMIGFGLALALPFALFALFPAWLTTLPKSGSWMNTVKVVLGFLELALAFKFLSNADLVGHWGLLKREIFIGIWIVLFVLLTLYLLGIFRFNKTEPKIKLNALRATLCALSALFSLYLILGLAGAVRLNFLSGFPPPDFYSIYEKKNDCPLGLDCYKDFDKGLTKSRETGKPILLDFTGWACVNCRKMEENVWSNPSVYDLLKNEFILVSLYVDDRKALNASQQFNFKYANGRIKKIKTIGEKWGTLQSINFNNASQPYYVLLSPDLEVLNHATQYEEVSVFASWLAHGLEKYQKDGVTQTKP